MKFYVQGMHCRSCVILIENELGNLSQIKKVKADLATKSVNVDGNFGNQALTAVAQELTKPIAQYGYTLTLEPTKAPIQWKDFYIALPIALVFIIFFILLQKLGIINWVETGQITYSTAFVIGIIASLSTCMAVVGGLVLSMSATFSKTDAGLKPEILFHVGRLIAFFILGGIIGVIGSKFHLTTSLTFILSLIVGVVLLILGINLLDIFPWTKKIQFTIPKSIAQKLLTIKNLNSTITPLLVGVVTFFLPCGFTQSMQLYTLTTGNFITGGLTMLAFALGTLPILALLSFSSVGLKTPKSRSIFFKIAGCVVLFFAVINILASLASVGILPPMFYF